MATTLVVMNMLNQRSYAGYGPHNDDEGPPEWVKYILAALIVLGAGGLVYAAFGSL